MVIRRKVTFQVDSGSAINILPEKYLDNHKPQATRKKLRMWNGTVVTAAGTVRLVIQNPTVNKEAMTTDEATASVNQVLTSEAIVEQFPEVFGKELGTFPGKVKLEVDHDVKPKVSK